MWGISIYLMRLADYIQDMTKRTCIKCNFKAKNKHLHDLMQKEHKHSINGTAITEQ